MPCSGGGSRLRVVSNIGAALQILIGGNISLFAQLCERARSDAFDPMLRHVADLGANAVIAMRDGRRRHDATTPRHCARRDLSAGLCNRDRRRAGALISTAVIPTPSRRTASLSNR